MALSHPATAALLMTLVSAAPLAAQETASETGPETGPETGQETGLPTGQATPPARIDLLADREPIDDDPANCSTDDLAGVISSEIVVCRRRGEASDGVWNKEEWENRYAAETRGPDPVDVVGPGIFRGPATVGSLCIPGLQKCPPPPAYFIDFDSLPDAPPGSDADRIARGLPPLGREGAAAPAQATTPARTATQIEALGLPPVPAFSDAVDAPVSPAGSAAPEAPR